MQINRRELLTLDNWGTVSPLTSTMVLGLRTEKYYSFHLPAEVNRVKGLTAIILKDAPDEKDLPQMERS